MKTAVLLGARRSELKHCKPPVPRRGEVLLKVEGCGICESSLPAWQGRSCFDYPLPPGSPGHEPWGRIAAFGEGVREYELGERVVALGQSAFAEYEVIPTEHLVRLPPEFDGHPFPGEELGRVLNIFERAEIRRDMPVALIGLGFHGSALLQLLCAEGAQVCVFSPRADELDAARAQGATDAIPIGADPCADAWRADTWQCVIECTGAQSALDLAGRLVEPGGRLVIAGYHEDGPRVVDLQLWNRKGVDVVDAQERDGARCVHDMHAAIEAIREHRLDPWPLITHRVGLNGLDTGFALLEQQPQGFLKAVACP